MSNVLLLAAILPALFIIYKVYQQDRLEKEPVGLMAVLIVMGILSAFGAIVLEYVGEWILDGFVSYYRPIYNVIYYFVIIAGSEEIMKYVFLKLGSYKNKAFNCMFDGIVYAVTVSLGFALFENILYVFESGLQTAIMRAITAVPAHGCFGVFMGVWYGYAKRMRIVNETKMEKKCLRLSLLFPILIHGAYDYILSIEVSALIFFAFVIVMFFATYSVVKAMSKDDYYLDE